MYYETQPVETSLKLLKFVRQPRINIAGIKNIQSASLNRLRLFEMCLYMLVVNIDIFISF